MNGLIITVVICFIVFCVVQLIRLSIAVRENRLKALHVLGDESYTPPPPNYKSWLETLVMTWFFVIPILMIAGLAAYMRNWLAFGALLFVALFEFVGQKMDPRNGY
jgi:hypothetical protein